MENKILNMKTKITIILIIMFLSSQVNGQTKESQLNGTFSFGLTKQDKENPRRTRAFDTRVILVSKLKQKLTFYGNGSGKGLFYKIEEGVLYLRKTKDVPFKPLGKINRPGTKNDYFEIVVQGTTFAIGLYKRK